MARPVPLDLLAIQVMSALLDPLDHRAGRATLAPRDRKACKGFKAYKEMPDPLAQRDQWGQQERVQLEQQVQQVRHQALRVLLGQPARKAMLAVSGQQAQQGLHQRLRGQQAQRVALATLGQLAQHQQLLVPRGQAAAWVLLAHKATLARRDQLAPREAPERRAASAQPDRKANKDHRALPVPQAH